MDPHAVHASPDAVGSSPAVVQAVIGPAATPRGTSTPDVPTPFRGFQHINARVDAARTLGSTACPATVVSGVHRAETCGRAAGASGFCGYHNPDRKRKATVARNPSKDSLDDASMAPGLLDPLAKQCSFTLHGAAGCEPQRCGNHTRDSSGLCGSHKDAPPPRKTRRYNYISDEVRQRIVNACKVGTCPTKVATSLEIPVSTVRNVFNRFLKTGKVLRNSHRDEPPNKKVTAEIKAALRKLISPVRHNDRGESVGQAGTTLRALCATLKEMTGVSLSFATMRRILKQPDMQFTMKNLRRVKPRSNDNVSVETFDDVSCVRRCSSRNALCAQATIDARAEFAAWFENNVHKYRMVYLDEQPWDVSMRRTRGRAPKGKPAIGTTTERMHPGAPKTASLLLAVSPEEGVMGVAYLVLETTRHEHIIDLLKDVKRKMDAVDALHAGEDLPPWMVVMDNVRLHTHAEVKAWLRDNHVNVRWVPAHSPMCNPIESIFSSIAARVKINWAGIPTMMMDPAGQWHKVDDGLALGECIVRAASTAASPDLVRGYEQRVLDLLPAMRAKFPLQEAGDPPSGEVVRVWEGRVREKADREVEGKNEESLSGSQSGGASVVDRESTSEAVNVA